MIDRLKILVMAATEMELQNIRSITPLVNSHEITFLETGVGSILTQFHLMSHLTQHSYDLLIQIGVAGSFDAHIKPGDVVIVSTDQFADWGAEDANGSFINFFNNGLINSNAFPFQKGLLVNPHERWLNKLNLPKVHAITVNTTSGTLDTIYQRKNFNAHIENMEGAAFHFMALQYDIPFVQIRGISNFVEPRNKEGWIMNEAMEKAAHQCWQLLK